jgi:hypothetical protein
MPSGKPDERFTGGVPEHGRKLLAIPAAPLDRLATSGCACCVETLRDQADNVVPMAKRARRAPDVELMT